MAHTSHPSSHGKLIVVVAAAALVVVLALLSAFVWPGWALNGKERTDSRQTVEVKGNDKPSIESKPLPEDATALLKAMPDSVLDFARVTASASATWTTIPSLEEYSMTYSTGDDAGNVTLVAAQWSTADSARSQYDALTSQMTGEEIASGKVKVNGGTVGSYMVRVDADDAARAVGVWQNDTVVFQATGPKDSVTRFYAKFPL